MKLIKTSISDLIILQPLIHEDNRGHFSEIYNKKNINNLLGNIDFVQLNESRSKKGVLRGLHYQIPPFSQAKLIRCIEGVILDVVVDLRKNSKTFGKYISTIISKENRHQLFIPRGFAHGFVVLSDSALVSYKVDNYYNPSYEKGIIWNDINLKIDWKYNINELIISEKDKSLLPFSKIVNPF